MELGLKQEKDLRELFEVEPGAFASGLFASVKRARSRRTGQLYAAKHSPKRKENYNEVRLLSKLISPYIISFKDAFETSTHVVVIMEFAPGGDMQSLIDADVVMSESHACRYIHQLLQGLAYLHSKNIAHLDIKPQNLLLMGDFPNRDSIIKICDFELSRVIYPNIEEREIVGTPDYVAPEILQYDPLSLKADIWSTGIVVYVLLTGFSPFGGETDTETFNNIIHNEIDFPPEIFEDVVSHAGIEFISWLCQKDVSSRPTAAAALQHVWLKSSRLSSRKKGMSKSTYDLTKGRDKIKTEKIRLRKSKSREQLWRSKIHLSLSSEKIERWASVASFSQAAHNARINAVGRDSIGTNGRNIRVHSEESLMTMILPTPAIDPQVKASIDRIEFELAGSTRSLLSNGSSSRNGISSNIRPDLFRPPPEAHENGVKLLTRAQLEELTPGEKIKETVGEDEVQKSVAELISKFGGTHITKKHGKGGGSSTATNSSVNLDPIEELDDQENNDNSLTGIIDSSNQSQQGRLSGFRKSVASNSSASSSGVSRSSSTTTIDDIKATLAQLLPLNITTPSPTPTITLAAPVKSNRGRDIYSSDSDGLNGTSGKGHEPAITPAAEEVESKPRSEEPVNTRTAVPVTRKTSTSFYVPLKNSNNATNVAPSNFVPFSRTRARASPKSRNTPTTTNTISTPTMGIVTTSPTITVNAKDVEEQRGTVSTAGPVKKPTNRFVSRCEMRIRERSNSKDLGNSTNGNSVPNVTTRSTARGTSAKGPAPSQTTRTRGRLSK